MRTVIYSTTCHRTYTNKLDQRRPPLAKDIKVTTLPPLKSAEKFISHPSQKRSARRVCCLPVKRPDSFPVPPSCKSPTPSPGIQFPPALALPSPLPRTGSHSGPPAQAAAPGPQAAVGRAEQGQAASAGSPSLPASTFPPRPSPRTSYLPSSQPPKPRSPRPTNLMAEVTSPARHQSRRRNRAHGPTGAGRKAGLPPAASLIEAGGGAR